MLLSDADKRTFEEYLRRQIVDTQTIVEQTKKLGPATAPVVRMNEQRLAAFRIVLDYLASGERSEISAPPG